MIRRGIPSPQGDSYEFEDVGAQGTLEVSEACGGAAAAKLKAPKKGQALTTRQVALSWRKASCATSYNVTVREGSKSGPVVDQVKGISGTQYTTARLAKGKTYFWEVESCSGDTCNPSGIRKFKVNK